MHQINKQIIDNLLYTSYFKTYFKVLDRIQIKSHIPYKK